MNGEFHLSVSFHLIPNLVAAYRNIAFCASRRYPAESPHIDIGCCVIAPGATL
jgi:hypothetical protein